MAETYAAYRQYAHHDIFGSVVKQQVLKFFSQHPSVPFSVSAVAQLLSLPESSLSVSLNALEQGGVLHSVKQGKYRCYTMTKKIAYHFATIYEQLDAVQTAAQKERQKEREMR